jgi:hypothetical protein
LVKGVGNVSLFHVPSQQTIILFGFRSGVGSSAADGCDTDVSLAAAFSLAVVVFPCLATISAKLFEGPAWLDRLVVVRLNGSILILLQGYNFPNENSLLSLGPRGLS